MSKINLEKACIGIELGSTRIKAVLIDENFVPVASGDFTWENELTDGLWSYPIDKVDEGVRAAYAALKKDVCDKFGEKLTAVSAVGISAMMHGYLAFDKEGKLLVPFRTWRNTNTGAAAEKLSELFAFNVPLRWSISHLYQAVLDKEPHVKDIASFTTLAGYVHEKLSGKHVLGVGDASGMFPIDSKTKNYDEKMVSCFEELVKDQPWTLRELLPTPLSAGEDAGTLTEAGALYLDPEGDLKAGVKLAPPEGDAGTGMTATCAVRPRTGNVSAGTSIFSMAVLEGPLSKPHSEIDVVTTPTGADVAMVHCNNCTSELNAWANVYMGLLESLGVSVKPGDVYKAVFESAMKGAKDCDGVVDFGLLSGEPVLGLDEGRPLVARLPESKMSFENFSRALVFSCMAALKKGMRVLDEEGVKLDSIMGHGGFFKTPGTAQKLMASAFGIPVTTMETAGEGGPWGMAILAAYTADNRGVSLEDYLDRFVFGGSSKCTENPDEADSKGFEAYMDRFLAGLEAEKAAVASIR